MPCYTTNYKEFVGYKTVLIGKL